MTELLINISVGIVLFMVLMMWLVAFMGWIVMIFIPFIAHYYTYQQKRLKEKYPWVDFF